MDPYTNSEFENLLKRAEEILRKKNLVLSADPSQEELLKMVHKLDVYQIELELQNDELKLARERAETLALKYTSLYDFAPIGYFTLSREGKIEDLNLFGAQMLGKVRSRLKGNFFAQYVSSKDLLVFKQFLEKVFASDMKTVSELSIKGFDGNSIIGQITGIVLDGSEDHCLLTILDVTDRKNIELKIQDVATRMEILNHQKDTFFSIIGHDLKGPFNAIIGYSELLLMEVEEKNYLPVDEYARIILQSSKRAMDLLGNIMLWAQSQTGRMEFAPTNILLSEVVEEVTDIFDQIARQKGITILKEIPENLRITADRDMLATVIRNLVSNAIKFTNSGGQVTIFMQQTPHSVVVCVKDNGVGFTDSIHQNLFSIESSHTSLGTMKEKGSGLGLILCREFVDKHGGKIWAESVKHSGSTFFVSLPN